MPGSMWIYQRVFEFSNVRSAWRVVKEKQETRICLFHVDSWITEHDLVLFLKVRFGAGAMLPLAEELGVAGGEPGRSQGLSRLSSFLRTHGPLADGNRWQFMEIATQDPRMVDLVLNLADLWGKLQFYSIQVRFWIDKTEWWYVVAASMAFDISELQKGAANITHKGAYVNWGRGWATRWRHDQWWSDMSELPSGELT